ncbi:MAG: NfeD family protein [Acidobacteriota bacterium]
MDVLTTITLFLCVGYFLVVAELFVPGGVIGIAGLLSIGYGCWLAFHQSLELGIGSILLSLLVFGLSFWMFLKNRYRKGLVLDNSKIRVEDWKAPREELQDLEGVEGLTLTPLRPAGVMALGDERIDVVSDSEFLDKGVRVRVVEVEGVRVVVEAIGEPAAPEALSSPPPSTDAPGAEAPSSD